MRHGPGGVLTVADDLLKNDGQKFLEMMESLADRRIQREYDIASSAAAYANGSGSDDDEDDDFDDEADDDLDDEDGDDVDDEDDEDAYDDDEDITEEERMEEGRRMFQVFAARLFEQRVLTAYREKVAAQRQKDLLRELEEEERLEQERELKKAKEAQRKKDKKKCVARRRLDLSW